MEHELSRPIRDCKGVRKEILYNALNSTQNLQDNVNVNTLNDLDDVMITAELVSEQLSLDEKVENQDEVVLDSNLMKLSSGVIRKCLNSMSKDFNSYNSNEYADFLIEHTQQMGENVDEGETVSWAVLEFEILPLFKKTGYFSNLSGALEPLPKKPIQRNKSLTQQKRVPLSQIKKPEKSQIPTENEPEEASLIVQKIRKLISRHYNANQSALDYFKLILHPTDFGKTIENILHVAFLVRDGYIKLFTEENGSLQVVVMSKESLAQAKSSGRKKSVQNILPLNFNQWQTLTKFYNIEEPMINF